MNALHNSSICPIVTALESLGDRWTLLVLRDLSLNPARRFQDLKDSLKGCAPNTLSARLKSLEQQGLIERRLYDQHPPRYEYILTKRGRATAPVLEAMRSYGVLLQEKLGS